VTSAAAPRLETARLILRPLELADAPQIQLLFPHWEVVKHLAAVVPWPYPPDGALTYVRDIALPAVARGEEWHWTLRLKTAPDRLIGGIGLKNSGVLKFPVLRVPKAAVNTPSRRVSEKQGMRIVATEERDYVSGRHPAEIWEITADEWNARRPR
jgi:RimJ/RimL family protein N-acetyltransferase